MTERETLSSLLSLRMAIFHAVLVALVTAIDVYLVVGLEYYPSDVILWSLCACYLLLALELLVLAVYQRR